jgi:hypothetical protein
MLVSSYKSTWLHTNNTKLDMFTVTERITECTLILHSIELNCGKQMIIWKRFVGKRFWCNLRFCPDIWLLELKETAKYISHNSLFPCRDLNPGPPEYEPGVLHTWPRRSVERTNQSVSGMVSVQNEITFLKRNASIYRKNIRTGI